ncbi:hypothetical protein P6F35_gp84 [Sphingomonas phage vB_StuS_MMDA13]|uniref:Uncharacterized protein n=1 Tax=Sphingomonas phage vB_StuS_MMDA13 TaxID=2686378 RepID=A0A7G3PIK3_9CAUD|nr:hypothetical protein P6F35_gp84 [Sphingomonas phage vB_StuS_MMDA13]QHB80517.1 hypothetical protein MMDA13_gp84 [Sphingomonas phage vB_StuS_MMDA13]
MATKPVLPYDKVQTFNFGGKVYPTEEAAITAVVTEIMGNSGVAGTVLARSEELVPLLTRYAALQAATAAQQG